MFYKNLADGVVIKNPGKFETGAKTTIRQVSQDYYQETNAVADTNLNNNFNFSEQVHAVYAIFGQEFQDLDKEFAKFKYQIGLRAEMVYITSEVDKDPVVYKNSYNSLYPSLHLVKPISKSTEITMSYSRRVNRPNLHALNPFSKYTDPLNLQVGNPELLPEYINSGEIGFGTYNKN
ncbi:MAG: TonB-dependent receptor family protein [Crocinitomicaceae bacterium]|nr:TonB-dependent receptor family protein [Crocinitomicaceae bacterium]